MFSGLIAALALIGGVQEGDSLKRLAFLEGKWESHETAKGPDGKDVPFTLKGNNSWILEGTCLQIDESFEVPGAGKLANHILMTFDKRDKLYHVWWFTNSSAVPITFTGDWVEKDLVLTGERLRILYHPLEAGHYKAELEVKRGEKWERQTVAEYKKTS